MSIETIAVELSQLRKDFEKHDQQDLQKFKYSHHMLEDLLLKGERFDASLRLFRDERVSNATYEQAARETLKVMDARLRTVERLAWTAAGGVGVIATAVCLVANHVMKLIGAG